MTHAGQMQDVMRLALPEWLKRALCDAATRLFATVEERMGFVIGLARRNVEEASGGPFAAGVFDPADGAVLAGGVNLVVTGGCSAAHAEIVALTLAQRRLGTHDLGAPGLPACELVTSTEPCAMCLGAIPWSGVRGLVCGARGEDACGCGWDEGDKPADWAGALERRGIRVTRDVLRPEALAVLRLYQERGGTLYNGRGGAPLRA